MKETLPVSSQAGDQEPIANDIWLADMILSNLGRQYLDLPIKDRAVVQPPTALDRELGLASFLSLSQIGVPIEDSPDQALTALQNVLAACHHPDRYTLIFLVASDGKENHIYLGIRSRNETEYHAEDFVNHLGQFLAGNWPGTKLQPCDITSPVFMRDITTPFSKGYNFMVAVSGIPSLKPGDLPGYPQSLDRLMRGLRGLPILYMVIAEPMDSTEVNDIIYRCREILGRVHTLTKTTLTDTESQSLSETLGSSENQSLSHFTSSGETRGVGLNVGLGEREGAHVGISGQFSHTETNGRSEMFGTGHSHTKGITSGEARAYGLEHLNVHAQAAEAQIEKYIERFEQSRASGCWNVGVYLVAQEPRIVQQAGNQLRALLSGEKSSYEPIRIHDLHIGKMVKPVRTALQEFTQPRFRLLSNDPSTKGVVIQHPLGSAFSGLTTPLNTEELALLVNLPRREVPGIPVVPTADFSLNPPPWKKGDIILGNLLEGGERTTLSYPLHPDSLTKHVLVAGMTGSGKSTTCRGLLQGLRERNIPFLVIEPTKDEYIEWAMEQNSKLPADSPDEIAIFMPGARVWRHKQLTRHLSLNPFDVIWMSPETLPEVIPHIDRLKSILNATFPMQESLPMLLEDALFAVYGTRPRNWLSDSIPPYEMPRPTLTELLDCIPIVVKGKGYEDRVTENLTAALMTRVQSLRRGWKGELFDQQRSTPWPNLFDKPVVINLSRMGDPADISLAMALLLQFLYEYRQAQRESAGDSLNTGNVLTHLTVVEEAHNVLLRAQPSSLEQSNPQGKVAELFCNILSEMRAYGEGIVIVDQSPARLVPDAIKNTNLKIIHRLVADDDRDAMARSMTLNLAQTSLINHLKPGQAIVSGDLDDIAAWVEISNHTHW
jgi:DNA helicase HerA-like ATPase